MGSDTTTVQEVRETERQYTYCDICGETEGTLETHTAEDGTERHFHDDCIDDITVDDPVDPPLQEDDGSMSLSAPSVPVPDTVIPPVIANVSSLLRTVAEASYGHWLRVLFWPIVGLWLADEMDIFGTDKDFGTIGEYMFGLMLWSGLTFVIATVLLLLF